MQRRLLTFFSSFVLFTTAYAAPIDTSGVVNIRENIIRLNAQELLQFLEGNHNTINGKPLKIAIVLYGKDAKIINNFIKELTGLPSTIVRRRIEERFAEGDLSGIIIMNSIYVTYQNVKHGSDVIALSDSETKNLAKILNLNIVPIEK